MGLPFAPARLVIVFALVAFAGGSILTLFDRGADAHATDAVIAGFVVGCVAAWGLVRCFRSPQDDDPNARYPGKLRFDRGSA